MLKKIKSRIFKSHTDQTVIITVKKAQPIDVNSSYLDLRFQNGDRHMKIYGHINTVTDFVELYSNDNEREDLAKVGINLHEIALQIGKKSIPLNH